MAKSGDSPQTTASLHAGVYHSLHSQSIDVMSTNNAPRNRHSETQESVAQVIRDAVAPGFSWQSMFRRIVLNIPGGPPWWVVVVFLFASCTKMKDVSNHSAYAPYVGREVATLKGYNLFKVEESDRHVYFADYLIELGNRGGQTRAMRLPAGTRLKIDRFEYVKMGGAYRILAIGTLLYSGKEIEFEHDIRMGADPIDPNEYPVPYKLVGP